MLNRLFRKRQSPEPTDDRKYQVVKSGPDLIAESEWRQGQIRQIKRLYSVTDEVWERHYLSVIERFAEYVQRLPASEVHHHSRPGGLLDHTLECLLTGSRVAQGYILPPNAEPETIASSSDKWRFGAFVAILAHDLGKIVTDIEVVYRMPGGIFQPWHPWLGVLPVDGEYAYRFKPRTENAGVAKGLHEKAAVSLLPNLLTSQAVHWLFGDPELLAQLLSTINHAPFGGGALAEIVRTADKASVGKDLGADTGVATDHTSSTPLHEKLVLALRKLITDGDLRQNRPGAAIWITEDHTWAVSKTVAEALRDELISEGHKGVPKSPLRIFSVLQDHKMILPNPNKDPVWQAEVQDHERSWNQKLTFLRFDNSILWSTGSPNTFGGDVVPVDGKGNPIEESNAGEQKTGSQPECLPTESPASPQETQPLDTPKPPTGFEEQNPIEFRDKSSAGDAEQSHDSGGEGGERGGAVPEKAITFREFAPGTGETASTKDDNKEEVKSPKSSRGDKSSGDADVVPRKRSGQAGKMMFKMPEPTKDAAKDSEILAWLVEAVEKRKVRVNEAKALVHVMDHYIALVSPGLFVRYLQDNPMRKKSYEIRSQGAKTFKMVQRDLEALGIHKSKNGQNVCKVKVTGAKSQSELSCYLIHKRHLPYFKKFSANRAISIP